MSLLLMGSHSINMYLYKCLINGKSQNLSYGRNQIQRLSAFNVNEIKDCKG